MGNTGQFSKIVNHDIIMTSFSLTHTDVIMAAEIKRKGFNINHAYFLQDNSKNPFYEGLGTKKV